MEPTDQTPPSSGAARTAPAVRQGRPSRILLTAVLVELIVIAAVCNQGVVHTLTKRLNQNNYADYTRGGIEAATTFGWRFAPASGQPTHVWAAQFAAIGTLLVLTTLGVLAVSRGVVTFWRVFVAVWAVVAAVTPVSIIVRNLLIQPRTPGPLQSRVGQSVYGYGEFGAVIVAGLALGLIVGLFAALLAVITRTKPGRSGADGLDGEDGEYLDTRFAPQDSEPVAAYDPPPWGVEPTSAAGAASLNASPTEMSAAMQTSRLPDVDAPVYEHSSPYARSAPQAAPWAAAGAAGGAGVASASEQTQQFATERQPPTEGPPSSEQTQQIPVERRPPLEDDPELSEELSALPPPPTAPANEADATAQLPTVDDDGAGPR